MNTFKHKSLYAAVVRDWAPLAAAGAAQAVSVNHDGLGQVLIYPYYTVPGCQHRPPRHGHSGRLQLAAVGRQTRPPPRRPSRSASSKARTAAKSFDFNLYLSAKDVWTAAIHPDREWRRHLHGGQVLHDADRVVELVVPDRVRQLRLRGKQ